MPPGHALYRSFFTFADGPPATSHELNGWGDEIVHDYPRGLEREGRLGVLYSSKDYGCDWDYDWRNKRFQRRQHEVRGECRRVCDDGMNARTPESQKGGKAERRRADRRIMNWQWSVRRLALIGLLGTVAVAAGCATEGGPAVLPAVRRVAPTQLRVRVVEGGKAVIRKVALEDYVRGSIISEFAPASGDMKVVGRMLEVQAVLSRTYAISHLDRHARDGYDLCATTHCQLYEPARLAASRWAPAAEQAVRRTTRTVLWFERQAALTLFHADCGGHTSEPATIWGGAGHPYLRSIADDGPAKDAHASWRYTAGDEAIRLALNADGRTTVGSRLTGITVVERDEAGRAVRVRLTGQYTREVRGEVLRDALSRAFGARAIKSTWFSVRQEGAARVFEGRGFGHGAGLCQAGAFARIIAGSSPSAVLTRYFPGTRLTVLR